MAGHAGGGPRHLPTLHETTRASAGPCRIPGHTTTTASPRRRLHRYHRRPHPQRRPGASLRYRADATEITTGHEGRATDGPAGTRSRATATATGQTSGRRRATLLSTSPSPTVCCRILPRDPSVAGLEVTASAVAEGGVRGSRRLHARSSPRPATIFLPCRCATTQTGQSSSP